ncbi:MAG TPA: enolase C-terminal domain-like protein [Gaiellales bacterium]
MSQATVAGAGVAVSALDARAYEIPLEAPESDGTARWTSTIMIVVEAHAGDETGVGYTYGSRACRTFVEELLAPAVVGHDAFAVAAAWEAMVAACRNAGSVGVASMAIAAVDLALWDLKARLLGLPLVTLLDPAREEVPVYGSGGFTSLTDSELERQLGGWIEMGIPRVKMKVGRDPASDPRRVAVARMAIGPGPELMADANGALSRKAALAFAEDVLAPAGAVWFEEPVSSDDLEGLRLLRDRLPAGIDLAAGEYGFAEADFARLLGAGAVDCLQADVTRCRGITGFLRVAALCPAHCLELSAHCAPAAHVHPGCAAARFRHLEYFHDHVRAEALLLDGPAEPVRGCLRPDRSRPGAGYDLKHADAERYAIR